LAVKDVEDSEEFRFGFKGKEIGAVAEPLWHACGRGRSWYAQTLSVDIEKRVLFIGLAGDWHRFNPAVLSHVCLCWMMG